MSIQVGDKVHTVLHGTHVRGICTKIVEDDPAKLTHNFTFLDGTTIVMDKNQVNREIFSMDKPLPAALAKKIKSETN